MGIEEQVTVWGYNSAGPLGSMMFKRYIIINKSNTDVEEMYISIWNDPDVGDASDDFVGCDTLLSLTYAYNANPSDLIYGNQPPAVGFDFLQGPIVPGNPTDTARYYNRIVIGKKNLPVIAHYFFINPDPVWRDPTQGLYQGTLEWYNFLQGKLGTTGDPFPDPYTGGTTKFALYGDPVAGTGWIDGMIHPAGDRRAGLSAGPFTIPSGDTQEVVIATIAVIGTNHINSVSLLRDYDIVAQDKYDDFFGIITGIEDEYLRNPVDFELLQNYPNPFNPSTNIGFRIANFGFVSLKVYDVLGNEVATLVDEYKPAGSYEVEFNVAQEFISAITSGVNFYQLRVRGPETSSPQGQAGKEILQTKKMILLR